MNIQQKLSILADAAKYDASCASSGSKRTNRGKGLGDTGGVGICHSYTPDGRCISLLKILFTNWCIYDCTFCVNRVSSDVRRARFTPQEVAWLTTEFYKRNYIEGLFLSSGIIQSPDYTMELLVETARLLREEKHFFGYVHLKAIPGASERLLEAAARYADRLSANIELPSDDDLARLAPQKTHRDVEDTMATLREKRDEAIADRKKKLRHAPKVMPAGQSTQMIVGASPSADRVILHTASKLYREQRLKRVYYSAFSPIPDADVRLPPEKPPLVREHRLYQADWLMRFYGFDATELTTDDAPDLDLTIDPKLAWALRHPDFFPVDVNRAERRALLRIPGLGARNVKRIVAMRKRRQVRLADLRSIGVVLKRAAPFLVAADANPSVRELDRADFEARVRRRRPRDLTPSLFDE